MAELTYGINSVDEQEEYLKALLAEQERRQMALQAEGETPLAPEAGVPSTNNQEEMLKALQLEAQRRGLPVAGTEPLPVEPAPVEQPDFSVQPDQIEAYRSDPNPNPFQLVNPDIWPRLPGRMVEEAKGMGRGIGNTLSGLGFAEEDMAQRLPNADRYPPTAVESQVAPKIQQVGDAIAGLGMLQQNPDYEQSSGFAEDLAGGVSQLGTQILTSVIGGPVAGMGMMGSYIAGSQIEDLLKKGVDRKTAVSYGLLNALIQTPMEQIGVGKVTKAWKPQQTLLKRIKASLESGVTEGITEYAQEYPDSFTSIFAENADQKDIDKWNKFLDELPETHERAKHAALIGATLGSVAGGAGNVAVQGIDEKTQEQKDKESKEKGSAFAGQLNVQEEREKILYRKYLHEEVDLEKEPDTKDPEEREAKNLRVVQEMNEKGFNERDKKQVKELIDKITKDNPNLSHYQLVDKIQDHYEQKGYTEQTAQAIAEDGVRESKGIKKTVEPLVKKKPLQANMDKVRSDMKELGFTDQEITEELALKLGAKKEQPIKTDLQPTEKTEPAAQTEESTEIAAGDTVLYKGEPHVVSKVNPKTYRLEGIKKGVAHGQVKKGSGKKYMYAGSEATGFSEAEQEGEVFEGKYDDEQRFEIDDSKAELNRLPKNNESMVLSDVINHDALFEQYPEYKNMPVVGAHISGEKASYTRNPFGNDPDSIGVISINPEAEVDTKESFRTLLHEIQHSIQEKEGFAKGGSPEGMTLTGQRPRLATLMGMSPEKFVESDLKQKEKKLSRYWDEETDFLNIVEQYRNKEISKEELKEKLKPVEAKVQAYAKEIGLTDLRELWRTSRDPVKSYMMLAGEIEARDTASRADLTKEERQSTPPYSSENISKDDAIVLKEGGESANIQDVSTKKGTGDIPTTESTKETPTGGEIEIEVDDRYGKRESSSVANQLKKQLAKGGHRFNLIKISTDISGQYGSKSQYVEIDLEQIDENGDYVSEDGKSVKIRISDHEEPLSGSHIGHGEADYTINLNNYAESKKRVIQKVINDLKSPKESRSPSKGEQSTPTPQISTPVETRGKGEKTKPTTPKYKSTPATTKEFKESDLKKITVKRSAVFEETGETVEIDQNAAEAMQEIKDEEAAYNKLLDCLKR